MDPKLSARGRRVLKAREPKVVEGPKVGLMLKGNKTSQIGSTFLTDLTRMKKPLVRGLGKRNDVHPFDNEAPLEFLASKNDASLFCLTNHSKKRPHNIVMGRTFDGHLLDMFELGLDEATFRAIDDFRDVPKMRLGSKPCVVFQGEWEHDAEMQRLQNFLLDFFRGDELDKLALKGIDRVLYLALDTSTPSPRVLLRHYGVRFKRSGTKVPNVELQEMGPRADLTVRRRRCASAELWRAALRQPKQLRARKRKNVETTTLGETTGRLHLERQDLDAMRTKRVKALRAAHGGDGSGSPGGGGRRRPRPRGFRGRGRGCSAPQTAGQAEARRGVREEEPRAAGRAGGRGFCAARRGPEPRREGREPRP